MTTHASHTEEYDAPCGTCRGEATYHVADDASDDRQLPHL